jgi:predicted HNH restriction endonuclease
VCFIKFFATATAIKKGATCSKECGKIAWRRTMKTVQRKRNHIRTDCRKDAKERDGFKCRICEFSEVIHVHHIHPQRRGGKHELSNLITLCPNHHAMVHAGMITPEQLIAAIAAPLPAQAEMPLGRVINFRK